MRLFEVVHTYNLQLYCLAIELDRPDLLQRALARQLWLGYRPQPRRLEVTYEVDANCRDVGLGVGVVGEPEQQARLANTRITDEQELEQVVVSKDGRLDPSLFGIVGFRQPGHAGTAPGWDSGPLLDILFFGA